MHRGREQAMEQVHSCTVSVARLRVLSVVLQQAYFEMERIVERSGVAIFTKEALWAH
jgi:hypothetical protein